MLRTEYPRPQFVRDQWQNLNGEWSFIFDSGDVGLKEKWYDESVKFEKKIQVPFVYQSKLSGIDNRDDCDIVWYRRKFDWHQQEDMRCLLHFGAVDYQADIYVNGDYVGQHVGGHTSFSFDITNYLLADLEQTITVRAWDPHDDEAIPRGKQFWESESRSIWYTNSTGIWQTVWLETVNQNHINKVVFTPDVDCGQVRINIHTPRSSLGLILHYKITFKDMVICEDKIKVFSTNLERNIEIYDQKIFRSNFHDDGWTWTPENPNLFDVELELVDESGIVLDAVTSYFGMRKIHTENGMVFLNNKPYYQKLVLDQGYWPEGLLTAPNDEAFIEDIRLAKSMGFNGCRKHQKVEDPRFLYWADHIGFIVWGECASTVVYTPLAASRLLQEWVEIVDRDYNHPSIVTWVPLNESWGVPDIHSNKRQQSFSVGIYNLLHALDGTRLVISNDGWEMTDTDICAIHNYNHGQEYELCKYEHFKRTLRDVSGLIHLPPGKWDIFSEGFSYKGQPILLTEFGGIGYKIGEQTGWGYTSVEDEAQFVSEYARIMEAVFASQALWGFCYTQLTDVEQEINGILTYDRQPKVNLTQIKEINSQFYPERIYINE